MERSDEAGAMLALQRRARRAYERARLLTGLRRVLPFAGVAAAIGAIAADPASTFIAAAALASIGVVALWRGGVIGRAAHVGLWAGIPPLLVPVILRMLQHGCGACGGVSLRVCVAVCTMAGAAGGVALGALAAREAPPDRLRFIVTAALFAGSAGAVGCVFAGAAGLLGMSAGLLLGGIPLVTLARAR